MKKFLIGFYVYTTLLVRLISVDKALAASPGTFDCAAPGQGACRVVRQSCNPGTKPDDSVCSSIGNDYLKCNNTLDVPCIPDVQPNTADCFIYNGTVCKAKNVACQQGYKEPCSGRSLANCVQTGAACVFENSNTTDCVFYPQSNSCQPTNSDCRPGYKAVCTSCPATGVSCVPDDQGPGPTIPVYDPECSGFDPEGHTGFTGVKTALGCLPTDPQDFVNVALPWAIFLGAGIAFLLGVFGAGMIVLSAGNPEKMQAGKEMITSAIAGTIIIVFAVFLLDFIGVKVLKLFTF